MLKRLHFIFLKRYQAVKPVSLAPDTQWLNQHTNLLEDLEDDALRYGFKVAFLNFFEGLRWRNQVYSKKLKPNS